MQSSSRGGKKKREAVGTLQEDTQIPKEVRRRGSNLYQTQSAEGRAMHWNTPRDLGSEHHRGKNKYNLHSRTSVRDKTRGQAGSPHPESVQVYSTEKTVSYQLGARSTQSGGVGHKDVIYTQGQGSSFGDLRKVFLQ